MNNKRSPSDIIMTDADWRVLDSLKVRNLQHLRGLNADLEKDIIRELTDGINAGEGMPDLSARISSVTNIAKTRADTIARTETINACIDGARQRYQQLGIEEVEIIACDDSRTCPICSTHDGKVYKLSDDANLPPYHPNCRCAIRAVVKKRDKKEELEKLKRRAEKGMPERDKEFPVTQTKRGYTESEFAKLPPQSVFKHPSAIETAIDDRTDLSDDIVAAIIGYRDLGVNSVEWDVPIPPGETHHDQYVINRANRDPEFKASLSQKDLENFVRLDALITTGISMSKAEQDYVLYKGLVDPAWIEGKSVGDTILDRAVGSYSIDLSKAVRYTDVNSEQKVFITRMLRKGEHAVYMGHKEEEMLLPKNLNGKIGKIKAYSKGEFLKDFSAKVYYIE